MLLPVAASAPCSGEVAIVYVGIGVLSVLGMITVFVMLALWAERLAER